MSYRIFLCIPESLIVDFYIIIYGSQGLSLSPTCEDAE
jgi:hypothetical protein